MSVKHRGVYERVKSSGIWWIRWADHEGKLHREKAGTLSIATALYQRRKSESLLQKKLPELSRHRVPSFNEVADQFVVWSKAHKLSWRDDHWRLGRVREKWGALPVSRITRSAVKDYLVSLKTEGKAPATVNRYRDLISAVFREALDRGVVSSNPVARVRKLREANVRVRYLTAEEECRLREVLIELFPIRVPELDLALNTGMRMREQYALHWSQVDFRLSVLTIPRSKHGCARHIRLNGPALDALRKLRELGTEPYLASGLYSLRDVRERSRQGRVFLAAEPGSWFKTALREAGINDFTWHDCRHTCASRLVQSGVHLQAVQEFMGHRSILTTMRYAHLAPDYQRSVVDVLARFGQGAPVTSIATGTKTGTEGDSPC